ncbi:hypothetical protein BP6252_02977 [Coleophoma cylindrospora]|uniref:Uncharacterized protein n=1 Tax=Coleophoma cylindrospora TaxID=1849047 RepID=A0A3D8S6C5_9HELO|nr:hypothetical protein BP6252_02977 [Coleophoma cylindrospora]
MNSQQSLKLPSEQLIQDSISCDMYEQTAINNALGTLLGYVGAEAATQNLFERLLWPQRFYNGFSLSKLPQVALMMPMGGPLHRAALSTLDILFTNGLFQGHQRGHMLGSPFFANTDTKYTVYESADITRGEKEEARNGLWLRVVGNIPIPLPETRARREDEYVEIGRLPVIRSYVRVSHLRIGIPTRKPDRDLIIETDTGPANLRIYIALVSSELVGIITTVVVLIIWRSYFVLLFIAPVCLKLLSAVFAVPREHIQVPKRYSPPRLAEASEKLRVPETTLKKYEIHGLSHGFLLIEGEDNHILQFFRHYGHPIRNRSREFVQFIIIISFALIFPVGLLCSLLWMPLGVQYAWLAYQLYATVAVHCYRYAKGHSICTTEEKIAENLQKSAPPNEDHMKMEAYFGHKDCVLMVCLDTCFHHRYGEGKRCMEKLITGEIHPPAGSQSRSNSESILTPESCSPGPLTPLSLSPLSSGISVDSAR